jgi:hypothetical protein
MTAETSSWEADWRTLMRPALLADVPWQFLAALRLRKSLPAEPGRRALLELRMADLSRRFLPEQALEQLERAEQVEGAELPDHGPLAVTTLRAQALIEAGRVDEARALVAEIRSGDGMRALVSGRLAMLDRRFDDAEADFSRAILEVQTRQEEAYVEGLAEALCYRGRLRRAVRDQDGWTADLDHLEKLCETYDAGFTQSLVRLLREVSKGDLLEQLDEGLVRMSWLRAEAAYTLHVEHLREQLAPIPVHVHGALLAHKEDSQGYVGAILTLAPLAWRIQGRVIGYETAYYGFRIGEKTHGKEKVSEIEQYLLGIEAELGVEELATLQQEVQERANAKWATERMEREGPSGN